MLRATALLLVLHIHSRTSSRADVPMTPVAAAPTSAPAAPATAPAPTSAPAAPNFATGSPELHDVQPAGLTRGATATLTLHGLRLTDAAQLLFYRPGFTVTGLKPADDKTVVVECAVAADCPLGEHPLRLRTAGGVTELRTVWVGALPVVAEVEPNGDFASPQKVPLNCTIDGVVTAEDVDYFAVDVKAGQRLTAEIDAMRLGRAMFDPAVAILDSRRFELATCDDSPLLLQDAVASIVAPADGAYVIAVREASLGGGPQCRYRLHLGTFPRPTVAYPPIGRPGDGPVAALLGDATGPMRAPLGVMPADAADAWPVFAADDTGVSPSPVWMRPCPYPSRSEPLPNTAPTEPQPPPAEPAIAGPPTAFFGAISSPGEVDHHRFTAAKGQGLLIEVIARRLRSPLDSVVDVHDAAGKWLAGADDGAGADSLLNWTAPEDGEYELRVRDHLRRGGNTFVYVVEVAPPRPSLALSLERIDARRPQHLQAVAVPRGNRFAVLVRADRQSAAGPVELDWGGLPAGVTVRHEPVAADAGVAPVVFEAAADAGEGGALVTLHGRIGGAAGAADLIGPLRQAAPLVIGPPNETVYYQTSVDRLAVAVTREAPFRIEVAPPAAPLLRQGDKSLAVGVERAAGFDGEVTLQMLWNPPGVSSAVSVAAPAAASKVAYPISASADAPTKAWQLVVLGRAAVGGGDVWVSSRPVAVSVETALFNGAIQMAATPRGQPAAVLVKLESVRAFEGEATLTLLGLPPHATCPPRQVTAADKEVVFEVATTAETPIGQHSGLFCQLSLSQNGETLTHRLAGGGVLRIDPPPPPPPAPTAAPSPAEAKPADTVAAAPPAAAPLPKPLSRLEQLRKQAAERAAAAKEAAEKPASGATP